MEIDGPIQSNDKPTIPELTDYIIVFSTMYGCVSFRHPDNGSVFIERLCDFLKMYAKKEDLQTILKRVRGNMKTWVGDKNEDGEYSTQMSPEENTLDADVYFDVQ